ncbi:hypothetical protein Tco_1377059 [Tanacetum coccineum]
MEKKTKNHQVSCTYFVASDEVLLDAATLVACSQPSCASTGTVSLFVFGKQCLVAATGAFGAHFNAADSSNVALTNHWMKWCLKRSKWLQMQLLSLLGSVETEGQSSSVSHKKDAEEISFLMKTSPTTNMEAARASQQGTISKPRFKMTVEKSIALQPAEVVVANETQVVVEIAEYSQSRKKKKRRPKLLPPLTPRYRCCNIFCECTVARNKGKAVHVKELQMLDISDPQLLRKRQMFIMHIEQSETRERTMSKIAGLSERSSIEALELLAG